MPRKTDARTANERVYRVASMRPRPDAAENASRALAALMSSVPLQ